MHFSNVNSVIADPDLQLYGESIPVVAETKFLGLILDKKLTFIPHIKYLKDRCMKALNLLRVVGDYRMMTGKLPILQFLMESYP